MTDHWPPNHLRVFFGGEYVYDMMDFEPRNDWLPNALA